jgi:hypothetical protein
LGGNLEVLKHVETLGGTVDQTGVLGISVGHMAARSGCVEVLEYILDKSPKQVFSSSTFEGNLLDSAALGGSREVMLAVLSRDLFKPCEIRWLIGDAREVEGGYFFYHYGASGAP